MKFLMTLLITLSIILPSVVSAEKFDYRKVIAPPIKSMGKPQFWKGVGDLNLLVSTSNEVAEKHVKQGFALLHAQWDVEAYRHFAAALEEDNDCLLAYCGVVMSMLNPEHEWKNYRNIALNRMTTLCEHKQMLGGEGDEGAGLVYTFPANERHFAVAIIQLLTEGYVLGSQSIIALADKYPNDIQFALMAPFLNRGKYDIFGQPNAAQENAVAAVKGIMDEHPENPLTINFYIMMLIEAPFNAINQKEEVLPYARKIVKLSGGELPTWHMLHGYAAWRSGELKEAKEAYEKAVSLYEKWKKDTKSNMSECDGLMRAYSFLTVIYNELGESKNVAKMLTKMEASKYTRKSSVSYAMYEWNQKLLKSKMLFAKAAAGDKNAVGLALKALPKVQSSNEKLMNLNKVIKGYQAYGLSLQHFQNGKTKEMLKMAGTLGQIIYELKSVSSDIRKEAYYPHYLISIKTLIVYHNELAGLHEEASGLGAVNWYSQAIDLQLGPSRLFPPNILYPMEYRLGKYLETQKELKKALVAYDNGLKRMPSHKATRKAFDRVNAEVLKMLEEKQAEDPVEIDGVEE